MQSPKLPFVPSLISPKVKGPRPLTAEWNHPDWLSVDKEYTLGLSSGCGQGSVATRFKTCWDGEFLYVIFHCQDSHPVSSFTERDQPLYEQEVVELFIAPGDDPHRYFEFELSPMNVVFDASVDNPDGRATMQVNPGWNCSGLQSRTLLSEGSWTVELAIPLAELTGGRPVREHEMWWINLYRIEREPKEEYYAWAPTFREPADFHCPENFGQLIFGQQDALKPAKVNPLAQGLAIPQAWSPQEVTKVNDSIVRVAVFEGFFHWHLHRTQDEMFYVLDGHIAIESEGGTIPLASGEGVVIPKGMLHRPHALKRSVVMIIEPVDTVSRGDE